MNWRRSCSLCQHVNDPISFNRACWECDSGHERFELDDEKLNEELEMGLVTKREAVKIIREDESRKGIPNQLRLPGGLI